MNIKEILKDAFWAELEASEGITKSDIDMIDLDIAFEPVTPFKGAEACSVIETIGGKYIVDHPLVNNPVSELSLKVMRFRYLQFDPGRVRQREAINNMFK